MELIESLGQSVGIATVLIFLSKFIITKVFDAALDTYRSRLEQFKVEHQIRYSKLHEERASILKIMFNDLYKLELDLNHFTSLFQGPAWTEDKERFDAARNQLIKCQDNLESNRIYFSSDFCESLATILTESKNVIVDMEKAKNLARSQQNSGNLYNHQNRENALTPLTIWRAQSDKVANGIHDQRLELAEIFREIIGVKISN